MIKKVSLWEKIEFEGPETEREDALAFAAAGNYQIAFDGNLSDIDGNKRPGFKITCTKQVYTWPVRILDGKPRNASSTKHRASPG